MTLQDSKNSKPLNRYFIRIADGKKEVSEGVFNRVRLLKQLVAIGKQKVIDAEEAEDFAYIILQYRCARNAMERQDAMRKMIKYSYKDYEKKKRAGYMETPDGFLSPLEIDRAGFRWNEDGTLTRPVISEIVEMTNSVYKMGEKRLNFSKQYITWSNARSTQPDREVQLDAYLEAHSDDNAYE